MMVHLNSLLLVVCLLSSHGVVAMKKDSFRSRAVSPSERSHSNNGQVCQPCSPLQHPTQPQCLLPTQCHAGRCSMDLTRCSAEYMNVRYGANIDLGFGDNPIHSAAIRGLELDNSDHSHSDVDVHPIPVSNPLVEGVDYRIDPVTTQLIDLHEKQHVPTPQSNQAHISEVLESSNYSNDIEGSDSIEENGEINSVDAMAAPKPKPQMTFHIHVGCKRCGKHITCEDDDDCRQYHQRSWCWKPKNSIAGWCKISIPYEVRGHWKSEDYCCMY